MYYKWLVLVATDYHRRWQALTEVFYVKLCCYDWTNTSLELIFSECKRSFCRIQKARWNRMVYHLTTWKQGSTPIRHQFSISCYFLLLPACVSLQVLMINIVCEYLFSFSHPSFILSVGYMYQILIHVNINFVRSLIILTLQPTNCLITLS
jgi:hypothetical protein